MAPDLSIFPVKIPPELQEKFGALSSTPTYFIDNVLRIGSKRKGKKKVMVITEKAVFICEDGYINRCVNLRDIEKVIYGGPDAHVALVIPHEGHDRSPSFDVLCRTGKLDYVTTVLRELITKRCRKQLVMRHVDPADAFPFDTLNLSQPPGWKVTLDPDVLHLVVPGEGGTGGDPPHPNSSPYAHYDAASSSIGRGGGHRSHHTPSGVYGPSPSPPPPATLTPQHGLGTPPSRMGVPPPAALGVILRKLEQMEDDMDRLKEGGGRRGGSSHRGGSHHHHGEADHAGASSAVESYDRISEGRSPSPSPSPRVYGGGGGGALLPFVQQDGPLQGGGVDAAARELSLRSYEEVKAMRRELADGGFLRPSVAWGDVFPTSGGGAAAPGGVQQQHGIPSPRLPQQPGSPWQAQSFAEVDNSLPSGGEVFCWHCHSDLAQQATVPRCSGCRKAVYCGRQCQTVHWGRHKLECQALAAAATPPIQQQQQYPSSAEPVHVGGLGPRSGVAAPGVGGVGVGPASPSPGGAVPQHAAGVHPGVAFPGGAVPPQVYLLHTGEASPSPAAARSKKKKKKRDAAPLLPPPPPSPPSQGAQGVHGVQGTAAAAAGGAAPSGVVAEPHMAPDAGRDRVYDTEKLLPSSASARPPPPPAPHSLPPPAAGSTYDDLFQSYKNYYTDVLTGENPTPPATLYS